MNVPMSPGGTLASLRFATLAQVIHVEVQNALFRSLDLLGASLTGLAPELDQVAVPVFLAETVHVDF